MWVINLASAILAGVFLVKTVRRGQTGWAWGFGVLAVINLFFAIMGVM